MPEQAGFTMENKFCPKHFLYFPLPLNTYSIYVSVSSKSKALNIE